MIAAALLSGADLGCADPAEPSLLLLVSVDTLRADHLGAYGGEPDLTPNLDALARESVVFERCYAPLPFTLPSVTALLTGRHPEPLGISTNRAVVPEGIATLAHRLRAEGWLTAAVVSNYVLREETGLSAGFAYYDAELPQLEAVRSLPERIAADTTAAALRMLDTLRREASSGPGSFLWVHYQDPHGPYLPPAGYRERYLARARAAPDGARGLRVSEQDRGLGAIPRYQSVDGETDAAFYRAGYAGEVRYLDDELGALFEGLRARGLWAGADVVFTADHGESLGEHDYWFAHGELLNDASMRVPLLMRLTGVDPGGRRAPASLTDVVPTLLAHLGLAEDPALEGVDLMDEGVDLDGRALVMANVFDAEVRRAALVQSGWRYDVELVGTGPRESLSRLDALEDSDPGRSDPGRPESGRSDPGRLARMRGVLREARLRAALGQQARRQEISAEDERMLRALGYLGPDDPAP